MFFTATMTHCTTCFRPLARLMALQRSNVLQLHKMGIEKTITQQGEKHLMDKAPEGTENPENSENLDHGDCSRAEVKEVYH